MDENPAERELIRRMLQDTGPEFRVESVGSVRQAIQNLESGTFDAVLLDLMLPGYGALEALLCLTTLHPRMPIVVLTGLDDEDLASMARERGAQDYLIKGDFQSDVLVRSLRYAIERQRRLRAERDILRAQQDERKRLARELHDGVIQSLSAILLQLQMEERKLRRQESPSAPALQQLSQDAQTAIEDVRRISRDLHPSLFEQQALGEALVQYASELGMRSGLQIEVASGCSDHLGTQISQHLYRIFQEGLRNVIRHADASRVLVTLERTPHHVILEIADDGCGFTVPPDGLTFEGLGIRSICERARLLGGVAEIRSSPGAGTSVQVKLPLPSGLEDGQIEDHASSEGILAGGPDGPNRP